MDDNQKAALTAQATALREEARKLSDPVGVDAMGDENAAKLWRAARLLETAALHIEAAVKAVV